MPSAEPGAWHPRVLPKSCRCPPPSSGTSWAALGCPSTGSRGCGRAPGTGAVENARAEANRELSSAPQHGSAQCCEPKSGIQCTYFVHNICIIHPVYIQGIYSHGDCIYFIHMRVYLSAFRGSEYFRHFFFSCCSTTRFPSSGTISAFPKRGDPIFGDFSPQASGQWGGHGWAPAVPFAPTRSHRSGPGRGCGAGGTVPLPGPLGSVSSTSASVPRGCAPLPGMARGGQRWSQETGGDGMGRDEDMR